MAPVMLSEHLNTMAWRLCIICKEDEMKTSTKPEQSKRNALETDLQLESLVHVYVGSFRKGSFGFQA